MTKPPKVDFAKLKSKCTVNGDCWDYPTTSQISTVRRRVYEARNGWSLRPLRARCGNSVCVNIDHLFVSSKRIIQLENIGRISSAVSFAPKDCQS